jgi:hypothetical protein
MSEKTISYLNSNYNEFREGIIDKTQKYYPDLFSSYNDASIGSWLIDVISDISDTLRYNIDRMYQETDVDSEEEDDTDTEAEADVDADVEPTSDDEDIEALFQ